MPEEPASLEELRLRIDAVDDEIAALLARRAGLAHAVAGRKRDLGLPLHVPEREAAVLARVASLADPGSGTAGTAGGYSPAMLRAIYREIISATRALEEPFRVAYLGPEATFTHQAATEQFGASAVFSAQASVADVFLAVERGEAARGVVPLENSTEGAVNATHDMLRESPLVIAGERILRVHQHLLGRGPVSGTRLVVSHPQALAQCRGWLAAHLPGVPVREVASTALAAERAAREEGVAAVASEAAARIHGLPVMVRAIEDRPDNTTRFVVVGREGPGPGSVPGAKDRTSLLFSVKNEAGSLYRALLHFKAHDVNLTRIESRPSRRSVWDYTFFVDFDGHAATPAVGLALEDVARHTHDFRVLGSYPRAAEPAD